MGFKHFPLYRTACLSIACLFFLHAPSLCQTNWFPPAGNGGIGAANPNNTPAWAVLGWHNDVARIRVGGNGTGSKNGLDIQTVTDKTLMRLLDNGNVGVGTAAPERTLDIRHPGQHGNIMRMLSAEGIPTPDNLERKWSIEIGREYDYPNRLLEFGMVSVSFGTSPSFFVASKGNELFRATHTGMFGIGTPEPTHRLHVAGSGKWEGNASSYTEINSNSNGQYIRQYANDGSAVSWVIRGFANNGVQAAFNSGGIHVNGTVKTREVNITNSGWADHVFSDGYPLMDLEDLRRYVGKHRHLPGIPTEKDVMENGVNLGEMNVKLLEKVEELTLYLLDQRSVADEQGKKIRDLESELRELKKIIKGQP